MSPVRDPFAATQLFPSLQVRLNNVRNALTWAEADGQYEAAISLRMAVILLEDLLDEERVSA